LSGLTRIAGTGAAGAASWVAVAGTANTRIKLSAQAAASFVASCDRATPFTAAGRSIRPSAAPSATFQTRSDLSCDDEYSFALSAENCSPETTPA